MVLFCFGRAPAPEKDPTNPKIPQILIQTKVSPQAERPGVEAGRGSDQGPGIGGAIRQVAPDSPATSV